MNKKILTVLGFAVAGVGGYFLYKRLKDRRDCMKFTIKAGYTSDAAKEHCKDKNWKNIPLLNPTTAEEAGLR